MIDSILIFVCRFHMYEYVYTCMFASMYRYTYINIISRTDIISKLLNIYNFLIRWADHVNVRSNIRSFLIDDAFFPVTEFLMAICLGE